jgi:hypothetical protein
MYFDKIIRKIDSQVDNGCLLRVSSVKLLRCVVVHWCEKVSNPIIIGQVEKTWQSDEVYRGIYSFSRPGTHARRLIHMWNTSFLKSKSLQILGAKFSTSHTFRNSFSFIQFFRSPNNRESHRLKPSEYPKCPRRVVWLRLILSMGLCSLWQRELSMCRARPANWFRLPKFCTCSFKSDSTKLI